LDQLTDEPIVVAHDVEIKSTRISPEPDVIIVQEMRDGNTMKYIATEDDSASEGITIESAADGNEDKPCVDMHATPGKQAFSTTTML
jgi:hypothetical protein